MIFEYQWPQTKGGEFHVLQEQISEFLGVLSFKRKYPGKWARPYSLDLLALKALSSHRSLLISK